MKKDKKWAQKEVDRYLSYEGVNAARNALVFAKGVINQLDEPEVLSQELPVIPKFVADYIEECKRFNESGRKSLYTAMDSIPKEVSEWMTFGVEGFGKGQELFARAWLDGYTVEKEQKYRVIDSHKVYLLAKEEDRNEVETVAKFVEIYGYDHAELDYNLTEQEVKDYDPRYMTFAKPVEELEE